MFYRMEMFERNKCARRGVLNVTWFSQKWFTAPYIRFFFTLKNIFQEIVILKRFVIISQYLSIFAVNKKDHKNE